MCEYLDSVDFPFTVEELRAALALMAPGANGDDLLAMLCEQIATVRDSRASAEAARSRGSTDPEEINEWVLALPDELYAALCVAIPSATPRVEALRAKWRASARGATQRAAMHAAGLHPLAPPTPAVRAQLDDEDERFHSAWAAVKARITQRRDDLVP